MRDQEPPVEQKIETVGCLPDVHAAHPPAPSLSRIERDAMTTVAGFACQGHGRKATDGMENNLYHKGSVDLQVYI
jgi:hypothetical protein